MYDCFKIPFIGLIGSCNDESNSGLFINDLSGMEFNLITGLAKPEQEKGEVFFRRIEKMAIRNTVRDFLNLVQKEFSFKDIISQFNIFGNWGDFFEANTVGFEINKCSDKLIGNEITEICFFSEERFISQIAIEENGIISKTIEVKVHQGENTVRIDHLSHAQVFRIYINFCGKRIRCVTNCACQCVDICNNNLKAVCLDCDGCFYSLNFNPFKICTVSRCDLSALVCLFTRSLADAVAIHCAILICREVVATNNLNPSIETTKDVAQALLDIYEGKAIENGNIIYSNSEYTKSLSLPVKSAINYIKQCNSICTRTETIYLSQTKFN